MEVETKYKSEGRSQLLLLLSRTGAPGWVSLRKVRCSAQGRRMPMGDPASKANVLSSMKVMQDLPQLAVLERPLMDTKLKCHTAIFKG